MRSKPAFFEPAMLRTNFRRFAPIWVLYPVLLLIILLGNVSGGEILYSRLYSLDYVNSQMAPVNMLYALALVQLLFGDLYSSRLCNGISSLPITRERFFGTQLLLGIAGSLLPNLLAAACVSVLLPAYRIAALWWFLNAQAEFLCFFGMAVLCAVCAGSRIGMVLLYGIVNFAHAGLAWLFLKVYAALVYGMYIQDISTCLSPVVSLAKQIMDITSVCDAPDYELIVTDVSLQPGVLLSRGLWALGGLGMLGLGLVLFRRRKAECAGDLLAFPWLAVPFLAAMTIGSGAVAHLTTVQLGRNMSYILLALGLAAGYLAGLMLLRRKLNIFSLRRLLPLAAVYALLLISLVLTGLDVMGIGSRVPAVEEIASVLVAPDGMSTTLDWDQPEEIRQAVAMHEAFLSDHRSAEAARPLLTRIFGNEGCCPDAQARYTGLVRMDYTLKDGSHLKRIYFAWGSCSNAELLRQLSSQPEEVFFTGDDVLVEDGHFTQSFLDSIQSIVVNCGHNEDPSSYYSGGNMVYVKEPEQMRALLEATLDDAAQSRMPKLWYLQDLDSESGRDYISVIYTTPNAPFREFWLQIPAGCDSTEAMLQALNVHEAA